jgi:EmrB/QacA subfamily drug resistance transporter
MSETSGLKKWLPLGVLALALFIVVLDTTIINVSIKSIIGDLHTDLKSVQWVITGYSLVLAAFTITGGRLGDIFGRKRMFVVGAVVFAIGSLIASRATTAPMLLGSVSLIEGIGAAMMLPSTASLILSIYKGKDRALAFGVYGAIAGAAATIGPILGGWLTTNYSWRWNYLINPLVVLVLLAGSVLIKESHERSPHRPDLLSIAYSALGFAGVVYGVIESSTYGWIKAKMNYEISGAHYDLGLSITTYAIVFGLLFIGLFLRRQFQLEKRNKIPLVSIAIFKNRQFMAGTTVLLVTVLAQFGFIFIIPVFFQGLLNKDAFHSGLAILPFSISILVASPLSGVLAGKFNIAQRHLIQIGLFVSAFGAFLLHQELSVDSTVGSFVPGLTFFGLGFGLAISQLANVTLSAVSVNQAGEASGVNNTFRQLGSSLGQALIGALLIASLSTQLNKDVTASTVIPEQAKTSVTASVATAAESLGTSAPASASDVAPSAQEEILRIKNDAIVTGARTGMVATTLGLIAALGLTIALPKRAAVHGVDLDKPVTKKK